MTLDVAGQRVAIDTDGHLCRAEDWSAAVAQALAAQEGIRLTTEHWEIIHLVQAFYRQYQLAPPMRPLVKYVATHLGADKGRSIHLLKLFPPSPARVASKIAGLPRPENCL